MEAKKIAEFGEKEQKIAIIYRIKYKNVCIFLQFS
jgi:putative Ca2+/H+ antiporter (TMEM165/GDT1 family)